MDTSKAALAHTLLAFFFRARMLCSPHHLGIFSHTSFIHSFILWSCHIWLGKLLPLMSLIPACMHVTVDP